MSDPSIGVLQRHESLAANLGAKLTGPLLLKSFEKLFDGPIKVVQDSFGLAQSPPSWLDIVNFARASPSEFILSEAGNGSKICRLYIRGGQVEISEEDYRLVKSGAPERVIPNQPIAEDELAEVGTLNILEARLAMLIKRADAVAGKARQLNYHLKGRKSAIMARKAGDQAAGEGHQTRTFTAQPFSAINARSPNPVSNEAAKLQQDLLEQFTSGDRRSPMTYQPRPKVNRINTDAFHTFNTGPQDFDRRLSQPLTGSDESTENQYRIRMAAKIEKLARGDAIYPPCDRCRRLNFDCTKHLTACTACTKKHAKCSWRDIRDSELGSVPQFANGASPPAGENGSLHGSPLAGNPDPGLGALQEKRGSMVVEPSQQQRTGGKGTEGHAPVHRRADSLAEEGAILTQIASAATATTRPR